ncbi:DUF5675 family protein [Candidatus Proelusimicrobium excrementi]|uniref:DUF5675 family protein n=1 Tax=Candidatus Proelusimicrobium excrementi TaxID=3416222 RepID=UPI003CC20F59|nr:hypothetical protein [Elusimicrobiaceae bacterium]
MNIIIKRIFKGPDYTIGRLSIDGKYFCDTLEDTVRAPGVKIPGKTAIPAGKYKIKLTESLRFKKLMPRLENVPGFTGVLIHSGNTAEDSGGCILVGKNRVKGKVLDSRETFARLFKLLFVAERGGEALEIEIN